MARRARRGEGTVYWSKADRRWIARYPLGVVDGKRLAKRVKCRSEREAKAELERLRRAYAAGGDPATQSLDAYLDDWLQSHGRSVRPSTLTSYRGHVRLHIAPLLGGIRVASLRPADVRRLITELERAGKSANTIRLVVTTLRIALGAGVSERSLVDNAAAGVKLPKPDPEPVHAMSDAEADAILDAVAGSWVEHPVRVWLGSGLRRGEVLGLDQGDVQDGFVRVRISKTKVRAVSVTDDAMDALRAAIVAAPRRGIHEPVFFSPRTGERMRGDSISHALPRILEDAGLGHLAPHALRHAAATLMVAHGVHMRYVAEQLGHASPALTARVYAHVSPDSMVDAVRTLERRRAR